MYINTGDDMKKILKGVFVPVVIAILFGYVAGRYVFREYKDNLYNELSSSRLYLVENGEYDTIDLMREENSRNNYVYYKDNNKYKTVIGITKKYDNIDKIKSLYSDNLKVYEYYVSKDIVNDKQDEYDDKLKEANDLKEVREVVDNILELYRNDDNIRLIAIN